MNEMSLLRPAPVTHHFPRNRRSPGRARAAYREWAAAQELGPATVETGELILGELTANAVPAATGPGRWNEVRFALDQAALRVEVSDAGGGTPVVRVPKLLDGHGRVMVIVSTLADGRGVTVRPGQGKTVRAALKLSGPDPLTAY
ncbi:ATP-binding protein [Streptomyces sp. NPDC026294]|uniref:ATP-binding protein n=1 Tax=Streptomyces sp. NPDC026294 TaxID=3155362 RepID=UPI0033C288BD